MKKLPDNYEGLISEGSLLMVDIVAKIEAQIPLETGIRAMINDFHEAMQQFGEESDILGEIYDEICEAMQLIAPEGTYFGGSEGDGADVGFWRFNPTDEQEEED